MDLQWIFKSEEHEARSTAITLLIYCQPNHLWKGQKAVKKLAELSGEKPKVIKQWLSQQAFWQVHLPAPKHIDRPYYEVTVPNEMHQFDLCTCPRILYMGKSINTF